MGYGSDRKVPRPAEIVDYDEDTEKTVRGTRRSATTKKHEGRSSKEKKTSSGVVTMSHAMRAGSETSVSPPLQRATSMREYISREERRKAKSDTTSPMKSSRPTGASRKVSFPDTNIPIRKADPSYYGISPSGTHVSSTPARLLRHTRPMVQQDYLSPAELYDDQPSQFAPRMSTRPPIEPISNNVPYYSHRESTEREKLASRFDRSKTAPATVLQRPASSVIPINEYSDQFDPAPEVRRQSIQIPRSTEIEDRINMPPPQHPYRRPSARDTSVARNIPHSYSAELEYEDRNEIGYESRQPRNSYKDVPSAVRRPSLPRGQPTSFHYGSEDEGIRVVTSGGGRRRSYYENIPRSKTTNKYEQKYEEAARYQSEVSGPEVPLTAEALRKAQRIANSTSTRSSASRDESDFRRSATTRTTRSGSSPETDDVTIKLIGSGSVNINGAEIKCQPGAELNITTRKAIPTGSERSGSVYGRQSIEERRSRDDRPAIHQRPSSKAGRRMSSHYP